MRIISFFLLTLVSVFGFSQDSTMNSNPDLKIEKGRFFIGENRATVSEFTDVMKSNDEAYQLALKAKSGYSAGNVLGFIGGFMVGWPIGTAIGGGDPNWALAGGGAAILAVAIPVVSSATKKMQNAVDIYEGNPASARHLDLKVSPGRVGFVYSF